MALPRPAYPSWGTLCLLAVAIALLACTASGGAAFDAEPSEDVSAHDAVVAHDSSVIHVEHRVMAAQNSDDPLASDDPAGSGDPSGDPFPPEDPSGDPSDMPSDDPSDMPSDDFPSDDPSGDPFPSDDPSGDPSDFPSDDPSGDPSDFPSDDPSGDPSDFPSDDPSGSDAPPETTAAPTTTTAAMTTTTAAVPTTTTTTAAPTTTTVPTTTAVAATTTSAVAATTIVPSTAATTATPTTATPPPPPPTTAVATPPVPTSNETTTPGVAPSPVATTPAPTAAPGALLLVRATLNPPVSCADYASMSSCFVVQLAKCIPWVTDLNEIAVYQFTRPDNVTKQTNVTFFLVYPQNGELNEPATQRMLNEINNGQLNCASFGIDRIRAATTDLPADAEDKSMSTLGVLFGFFVVFCVLGAFIALVLRKRKTIARGSEVSGFVKQLEDLPDEELECIFTKTKQQQELEAAERQRELEEQEQEEQAAMMGMAASHDDEMQRRLDTGVEFGEVELPPGADADDPNAPLLDHGHSENGESAAAGARSTSGGEPTNSGTESTQAVEVDDIDVVRAVPSVAFVADGSSSSPMTRQLTFAERHGGIDIDEI